MGSREPYFLSVKENQFCFILAQELSNAWYPQWVCWYRRKYLTHSFTHSFIPCLLSIIAMADLVLGARDTGKASEFCLTLCNPMDCGPPSSSVQEIFHGQWQIVLIFCPLSSVSSDSQTHEQLLLVVCISFQWLLSQITTNFVTYSNTNTLSDSSEVRSPIWVSMN